METSTVIDRLLAEQRMLTAVERFAHQHDHDMAPPTQARYYRDLIPLTTPQPGQQYAFEVDLDKCSGCKACVTACHSLNGLEETESWRSVGWLHGGDTIKPYQQTVTTACHHCADPGCLNGCPVLAYEKDPITGIVSHLDDQCIGCQYCVWKCPYEVPRYSSRLGVVRKCDMCQGRLSAGEAPACVQSCPNEAIRITIQPTETITQASLGKSALVPGAPRSRLTQPSTRYLSKKAFPENARPADAEALRVEPAHWPLVLMLVLTQFGVGGLTVAALLRWLIPGSDSTLMVGMVLPSLLVALIGLAASGTHLGQPLRAWKIFLGWRRSWLSREAMTFGAFASFSFAWLGYAWWTQSAAPLGWHALAAGLGLLGVGTSLMIYHDTGRFLWRARQVVPRFLGTTLLLGSAAGVTALVWSEGERSILVSLLVATLLCGTAKLGREFHFLRKRGSSRHLEYQLSVRLLQGPLRAARHRRVILSVAGLVLMATLLLPSAAAVWGEGLSLAALLCLLGGELGERYLFFTAVSMPRMPGGLP